MINVKSILIEMDTRQVNERIQELKALIKAQEKYDNFFLGNVVDSRELQSTLSVLQQPTITAIEKSKEQPIDVPKIESETHKEKKYSTYNKNKYKLEVTMKDDGLANLLSEENTIPFHPEIKIYNSDYMKNFIAIYLNEIVKNRPITNEYIRFLQQIINPSKTRVRSVKKQQEEIEEKQEKKEGQSLKLNPLALFEKLTILISAAKSGHDNVDVEIKKLCKKLKIMGLISNKIYDKYKAKYFKS